MLRSTIDVIVRLAVVLSLLSQPASALASPTGHPDIQADPVVVTVIDTDGNPEAGLNVYAFDGTSYTGYNQATDAAGQTTFTLPDGSYRFRADKNGTQFWSGESNHCSVPGCTSASVTTSVPIVVTVADTDGNPESGLKVYAFNGTTYMGYNKTTDASGQAVFTLPLGNYRFRADKNGAQFWSGESNHCSIPGCTSASVTTSVPIVVTVADTDGNPESGLKVYAFDGTTYTGYNKTTDIAGQATFTLPLGDYRFRVDKNGTQFWSGESNHCSLPGCTSTSVTTSVPVVVTVEGSGGNPEPGLSVYVFDETSYTGFNGTSDAFGQVTFTLPLGQYRFRADKNGTQYWSGAANHCAVPGCTTATVTIASPDVTITVQDTNGDPESGLPVYVFDGPTYTGYNATSDDAGQVPLTLPAGSYRFRADKNGTQFWSGENNHCAVPGCTGAVVTTSVPVVVTVADTDGDPEASLSVYAFDETTYTGYNKTTDASGQASFTLPLGEYRFRADKNGTQFWSGENNHCSVPGCVSTVVTTSVPVVVTVADSGGNPEPGLNVYAFNGTTYTGYNKTTDASGVVTFTLPLGEYRFRADKNGTQYWSGAANHCSVPGCTAATVTIASPDVTITVQDTDGNPESGLPVYVFDGPTYTGYNSTSDASGQAIFTLPAGNYRFRADKNGTQFWSSDTNHCAVPGCAGAVVTTSVPIVVTVADTDGNPETGLNVYAFDGTTYTGYNKTTDASGQATFTLPLGEYRFRADKNGTQFWSGESNHCSVPGCTSASVTTSIPIVVTVADTGGDPEPGLNVYAFDETTYTGYNQQTDTSGVVTFTLPLGEYRFRADKNGTQFWSGEANHCSVPGCVSAVVTTSVPIVVTVADTDSHPEEGLNVYAFDETTYTGYNQQTDTSGVVTFTLPLGEYRFRADKNGTQFWSGEANHCSVPGCTSMAVTTTIPVTVTVADTVGNPEPGLNVYAFDETTYTGFHKTTDAAGEVAFTLPLGDYRFRADKDGEQYWSGAANHCPVPGCTAATITTPGVLGLAISKTGPATAIAGDPITYTLTLTNSGSVTATNLVITDVIPVGASYLGGGTKVGNVVSWTVDSLAAALSTTVQFVVTATETITNSDYAVWADGGVSAAGQEAVVTLVSPAIEAGFSAFPRSGEAPLLVQFFDNATGDIDAYHWDFGDTVTHTLSSPTHTYTAAGVYTVSLTVSGPKGSDTLTRPNYITVTLPPLAITKVGPVSAGTGAPITYTLTVTNSGSVTATNLVITDAIPVGASYVTGGTRIGNVVSWTIDSLAASSSTSMQFVVTATETITNYDYAVVADGGISAVGQAVVTTTIGAPELTISKTGPASAIVGEPIIYTLTVTNSGSVTATNLIITDVIPPGASYMSGGARVGNTVQWTRPFPAQGESAQVSFAVTASETITNSDYGAAALSDYESLVELIPDGESDVIYSVAIDGDTAIVGTPELFPSGAAYIFVRGESGWTQQAKLIPDNPDPYYSDGFGWSVALDGDTAVVGANRDYNHLGFAAGAVYVFERNDNNWGNCTAAPPVVCTQTQTLVASDGTGEGNFGWKVAVDGETLIVGAEQAANGLGAAYIFAREGGSWTQQAKLATSSGQMYDGFGIRVDLNGDVAIVSAISDNGPLSGAAYVFERTGGYWGQNCSGSPLTCTETQRLIASDGVSYDEFGYSVAISGDTAVIGSPRRITTSPGAAYVFERTGDYWGQNCSGSPLTCTETQRLIASDGVSYDEFGYSVAISGDTAVIGSPRVAASPGAAYVFGRTEAGWVEQPKLTPSSGSADDDFGLDVALSGNYVIIGGTLADDGSGSLVPAAHVFGRSVESILASGQKPVVTHITPLPPPEMYWWNDDFFYRRPLTLTAAPELTYDPALTQVVELTLDTTDLMAEGKLRPDAKDVRVAYWDNWQWTELPLSVDTSNAPTTTVVLFPIQATITSTTSGYWLYYGNQVPPPAPALLEDYAYAESPYTDIEGGIPDEEIFVDFQAEPVTGLAPLEVTLTSLTFPEPEAYQWDFGDGGSDTLSNTVHIYETPSVYTVSLAAITDTTGSPITFKRVYPGLIWVAGLDVSDEVTIDQGNEETPVVSATLTANPATTHVITSAEGNLTVAFPPGALAETLEVAHNPHRAIVDQGSGSLARFDLTAETLAGLPAPPPSQPLELTLDLANLGLSEAMAQTVAFFTWDETANSWEIIPTTIDLAQNVAVAQINHFTNVQVFATGQPGGPPPVGAILVSTVTDVASGASTFNIPIAVPPGTAGMQPVVSIGYSSLQAQVEMKAQSETEQENNEVPGLLGIGTYLNLSYIARRSLAESRDLNKLAEDEYYLVMNGRYQKLIRDGDVYHTADETFWKIERVGPEDPDDIDSCANHPDLSNEVKAVIEADCAYWQVTSKDGTIYTFGQTLDSIQRALVMATVSQGNDLVTYPGRYYLNKVEDINGNYMTFEYDHNQEYHLVAYPINVMEYYDQAIYLKDIKYTGNQTGGLSPQRQIHFEYEGRAEGSSVSDFPGYFVPSVKQDFHYNQRLATIETQVDGNLVRRYEFEFDYLSDEFLWYEDHYLTLKKVLMTGNDDSTRFDLDTVFDYYDESPGFLGKDNEFVLLKRVNTRRSSEVTSNYNTVEYEYEVYPDRTEWLVSKQTQTGVEAEPMELSYHYARVYPGNCCSPVDLSQGQGPAVQFLDDGSVRNYGFVPYKYWRVGVHNSSNGRTTVQAFHTNDRFKANPLAGRLIWTEVFVDPQENCLPKNELIANIGCALENYLTGQYLTYHQHETVEDENNPATFVVPETVIRAIGPLDSGVPQDWTETHYEYDDATGNPTMILELNEPDVYDDGRATEFSYDPTPDEEIANILNRPDTVYVYPTKSDGTTGDEVADTSDLLSCTRFSYEYNSEHPAALDEVTQKTYRDDDGSCPTGYWSYEYLDLESTITFDAFSNVLESEGAAGNYQVEYDPTYHTFPEMTTYPVAYDKPDLVAHTTYDPGFGLVETSTAVNGTVTTYQYDPFGQPITITVPAADEATTVYNYNYSDTGLTLTVSRKDGPEPDDWLTTKQYYNGLGQLVKTESDGENGTTVRVDYRYQQGRLWQTSVPYTGASTDLWTTYQYDDLDRIIVITHPDDTTLRTEYTKGWSEQKVIDENGHATDYLLDAWERVKEVTEYKDGPQTTQYQYDAQGNLTRVEDDDGNETLMTYDSVGRMLTLDDPDQGHWEYEYESDGPLFKQTAPATDDDEYYEAYNSVCFEYDTQNRLTAIEKCMLFSVEETGSWTDQQVLAKFGYDDTPNGRGQRTAMTDASGRTTYLYDEAGRLITETRNIDGILYETAFDYDPLNRVKTLTYPDGEEVDYTYNDQGLLETMTAGSNTLVDQLNYNALGQPTLLGLGNQLDWTFEYNDGLEGRGKNLALHRTTVSGLDLTYTYDAAGLVDIVDGSIGGVNLNLDYDYDALNRLESVTEIEPSGLDLARSYSYNQIGNLTSKDGLTFDYTFYPYGSSTPKHAPGQVGNLELGYDARGNRSSLAGNGLDVRYEYDALNRLSYVFSDTTTTQFVYDGDGQRVKRITEEGVTVTIGQHYEVFYPTTPNESVLFSSYANCRGNSSWEVAAHGDPHVTLDSEGGRHVGYYLKYVPEKFPYGGGPPSDVDYLRCHSYTAPGGSELGNTQLDGDAILYDLAADTEGMVHAAWRGFGLEVTVIEGNQWGSTTLIGGGVKITDTAVVGTRVFSWTHIVWTENQQSLHYALTDNENESLVRDPVELASGGVSYAPQVAVNEVNGQDMAHIVWRETDPDDVPDPGVRLYYLTIDEAGTPGSAELIADDESSCPVSGATLPALALGTDGTVYVAWGGRDAAEFNSSGPVCYAQRSPGGGWSVTALAEREAQGDRFALDLDSQGRLYLLRGVRDRLGYCRLDGVCPAYYSGELLTPYQDNKADYGYIQEVLYVERYASPEQLPDTFLVNTYPGQDETGAVDAEDTIYDVDPADLPDVLPDPVSMLSGDLAVDDAGNVTVVWVDNYEAWQYEHKPRPRTVTIPADAPPPQVTKHYYANGQRIASRVDGDLYYILGDNLGSTSLVVNEDGTEEGHVIYDAYGQVVENTLPEGLTDRLFTGQIYDATIGLYFYNARYYDPLVGQFTQPDSVVAGPMNPAAWNRYSYVYNSPSNFVDPSGHAVTPWDVADVGFFFLGLGQFIEKPTLSNLGWLALDTLGLLPVLPNIAAVRHAGKLDDAARVAVRGRFAGSLDDIGYTAGRLLNFSTFGRKLQARSLVNKAARISGVKTSKYVDVVEVTAGPSRFVVNRQGQRIIYLTSDIFDSPIENQLVEASHEFVHAQQFEIFLRKHGGDILEASVSYFNVSDFKYAFDEVIAERLAARRVERYLGGLSWDQTEDSIRYINRYRRNFWPNLP